MADIKTWKKDFLAKRDESGEAPISVAQRFINIYRQLPILGEEAIQNYNALILEESTPEILIALTSLPGGEEIREYINYLQDKDLSERTEQENFEQQDAASKLPMVEELSPLWETIGLGTGGFSGSSTSAPQGEVLETLSATDKEYLRGQTVSLVEQMNADVIDKLKYMIIDSDIEKMQENMNNTIAQVKGIQDAAETDIRTVFSQKMAMRSKQQRQTITKNINNDNNIVLLSKNLPRIRKKPSIPTFSVRLIDEEE